MSIDFKLLTEQDTVLSACGRPMMPRGAASVDIPKKFLYSKVVAGTTLDPLTVPVNTVEKVIEAPVPFLLKSISMFQQPPVLNAVLWRLRLPNGRYLQANETGVSQAGDCGSYKFVLDDPIECAPGSKLWVTLDGLANNATLMSALSIVFGGWLRYPLRGIVCKIVGERITQRNIRARYTLDPNQNIMAPEWRLGNQCYPETPPGVIDRSFEYCTPRTSLIAVPWTGEPLSNVAFLVENTSQFVARFISFRQQSVTGTASGTLAVRITTDTGYEITDGFTPISFNGPMFPELPLSGGGALYIDFMVVDGAGTEGSTINYQVVLGGVKRN